MQSPPPPTECVHLDITVVPTAPPPKPPTGPSIPPKLLAVMMKYKHNWRLDQLSIPRKQRKKFVPKVEGLIKPSVKKPQRLKEELKYYADQVSRPRLRYFCLFNNDYALTKRWLTGICISINDYTERLPKD